MTRRSTSSVVAGLLFGMAAMTVPPSLHAQAGGEPAWPQSFQIPQGETRGFAFVVTQPGPITINIKTQGTPVTATLSGPVAGPLRQAGSGAFTIAHTATAAEVQKSSLWIVNVAASGAPPALKGVPQIVAQGAITVQHPASDASIARAELQRRVVAVRPMATPVVALVSAKQTAYLNQIAAQQGAQKQALMAQIGARAPTTAVRPVAPKATAPSVRTSGAPGSGQPSSGTSGSASAAPPPQIASLNVNRGQPGDPVLITGSGFGNAKGQVHFMVGSGPPVKDDTAPQIDYWSDTQILVHVPPESGIQGYNGQAYVKNANGSSQLVLFQFVPQLQYVSIDLNIESTITDGGGQHQVSAPGNCRLLGIDGPVDPGTCVDHSVTADPGSAFTWHSNDDQFFPYLKLLGGWTTESVELRTDSGPGGGAYLADKREGTSSPLARVHWWVNPMGEMKYSLTITIKGPNGVPYR